MILHLVRHPQPVVPANTCYGRLDVPAEGVEAAAERLRSLLPAGLPVWTSPLVRCRLLAERLHPAPAIDERLAEMHFGDWEGRTWDDIGPAALDAWAADVGGFAPPGGESALALQARALEFVAELAVAEAVLVTHAGVMRMLLAHWLGLEAADWTRLNFGYGAVTSVELTLSGGTVLHLNR
ncbi:MAG: alpha-ribazole phosphatase family protein [Actinomycetota bacterium]